MHIKIWGSRGSFPIPEKDMLGVGGNTTCIEFETPGGATLIFDAGSGMRRLVEDLNRRFLSNPRDVHVLFTHFHLDHMMGMVYLMPLSPLFRHLYLYYPNKVGPNLFGVIGDLATTQYWPVSFQSDRMSVITLDGGVATCADVTITWLPLCHPGGAFGYRVDTAEGSWALITDVEYMDTAARDEVVRFCQGVKLLIHDAQYTQEEYERYAHGWGHSTISDAAKVAQLVQPERLLLTHLDPKRTDEQAAQLEADARALFPHAEWAREGMVVTL